MKTYKERTASIIEKAETCKKKRRRILVGSVVSGVAAALLAFNLVLFVPYTVGGTDISAYGASEYYGVIRSLYGLTYSPYKTNNFTEWFDGLFAAGFGAPKDDAAGSVEDPAPDGGYNEVTLNQTDGVTEGDLFKRSDAHIFYLDHTPARYEVIAGDGVYQDYVRVKREASYDLRVCTIAGEQSQTVAAYSVYADDGFSFAGYAADREMYLSKDLTAVTVISPCYEQATGVVYTVVIDLDVSDLSDINETGRAYVSGRYVSSRVADGNMLLITDFSVRRNVDFGNELLYVPHYGKCGQLTALPAADIVCPEDAATPQYTVVCSLDNELNVNDCTALLSFSDEVYVSQNNLFATRGYSERVDTGGVPYSRSKTEIRIIPYDGADLGDTRSVTLDGSVLNRYCLDEYDGTLRAATTVRAILPSGPYVIDGKLRDELRDRCLLYCVDMDSLEAVARVEDFAPAGESVKSARFYGNTAYVCTAEVNYGSGGVINITDPVFAFDLSDPNNITYTDTGTIPGYSLSLTRFAFDTLLGVGFGDGRTTLKVELYAQTETSVTPCVKYEAENVKFSSEFKARMIDAENGLIGLGVQRLLGGKTEYLILRYDGYELIELTSVEMTSTDLDTMRATVVDGYVYIFENGGARVAKVN